jgi:tRNA U34 5-methylaminomethyl-2-thiouridine-forming methyltransferase MnmC
VVAIVAKKNRYKSRQKKHVNQKSNFLTYSFFFSQMEHVTVQRTRDGTDTLFNTQVKQTYHAMDGAIKEAFGKYANAIHLKPAMRIADFCFGLGYNTFASCMTCTNLTIYCLELDRSLFSILPSLKVGDVYQQAYDEFSQLLKNAVETHDDATLLHTPIMFRGHTIYVIIGDARQTIKELTQIDGIYFDPFSPAVSAHMWESSVFSACYQALTTPGYLATYSCARLVRENMSKAGFTIQDGPIIGRRSPSTIGIKSA